MDTTLLYFSKVHYLYRYEYITGSELTMPAANYG